MPRARPRTGRPLPAPVRNEFAILACAGKRLNWSYFQAALGSRSRLDRRAVWWRRLRVLRTPHDRIAASASDSIAAVRRALALVLRFGECPTLGSRRRRPRACDDPATQSEVHCSMHHQLSPSDSVNAGSQEVRLNAAILPDARDSACSTADLTLRFAARLRCFPTQQRRSQRIHADLCPPS
jgi:hypothetical protein